MIGREGNKNILHGRKIVIDKEEIDIIPDIIIGVIRILKGESIKTVLKECDIIKASSLGNALCQLSIPGTGGQIRL